MQLEKRVDYCPFVTLRDEWLLKIVADFGSKLWCICRSYDSMYLVSHPLRNERHIMTENVNPETVEAEDTTPQDAPQDAPQAPEVGTLPPLLQVLVQTAEPKMSELKSISAKQSSAGDVGKLLSEAIESSEDEEVVKFRERVAKAHEAINQMTKAMEDKVRPTLSIPTDAELAEMDSQYKTLASELNSFNQVFSSEAGKTGLEVSIFDYVGEIPGKRRGVKAGQGTGTARPRVKSVEYTTDLNGENGWVKAEKDGKSSFSHLIGEIYKQTKESISATDLHAAWLDQNGLKEWTDAPEVSKFNYSLTDGDGKTHQYWVRVTR
jgi:predicted CopG family antitoxin